MTSHDHGGGAPLSGSKQFIAGILDLRFQQNLTMKLLPLFYAVSLMAAAGAAVLITAAAFWLSPWAGLATLFIAPFGFLAAVALIRAALEYLVMAYRIMETINRMERIPGQMDNLNAQVDGVAVLFGEVTAEVNQLRKQFHEVSETVGLLRPVLHTLSLPGRLARNYGKRD